MWYDRSKASMMLFLGAALALMGIGVYSMGHMWPGIIMMITGVAMVVIGFTIVKFYLMLSFRKK